MDQTFGGVCPWCRASLAAAHYIHGHLACGGCGLNIGPCCDGERACSSFFEPTGDGCAEKGATYGGPRTGETEAITLRVGPNEGRTGEG